MSSELLHGAIRQYRDQNENEYVCAYDIEEADKIIECQQESIAKLEADKKDLQARIAELEVCAKKAFWWSAEFTGTLHNNKIQKSWEDFHTTPMAKPLMNKK